MASDLVERLAKKHDTMGATLLRADNQTLARWWLGAIADELEQTLNQRIKESPYTLIESGHNGSLNGQRSQIRWLRVQAEEE